MCPSHFASKKYCLNARKFELFGWGIIEPTQIIKLGIISFFQLYRNIVGIKESHSFSCYLYRYLKWKSNAFFQFNSREKTLERGKRTPIFLNWNEAELFWWNQKIVSSQNLSFLLFWIKTVCQIQPDFADSFAPSASVFKLIYPT